MKIPLYPFLALLLSFSFSLDAQQPLPEEDPGLYLLYFHFHDRVSGAIQEKKVQLPKESQSKLTNEERQFARRLHVEPDELVKVTMVSMQFAVDLGKWQQELQTDVEGARAKGGQPDPGMLADYDQKKLGLIGTALAQLQSNLSAASWQGLHAYINHEHRLNTRKGQLK